MAGQGRVHDGSETRHAQGAEKVSDATIASANGCVVALPWVVTAT